MKIDIGFRVEIEKRPESFIISNEEAKEEIVFTKSGSRYRL